MWARNQDGRCAEFVTFDPAGRYHPSLEWVEVPTALRGFVDRDYLIVDRRPAPPTLDHLRRQISARVAERRYRAETAGITVGDLAVPTDDRSKALLASAATVARNEPARVMNWKTPDGQWQQLPASEVVALAETVAGHVQACFDREAAIAGLLAAATTVEALLTTYQAELDQGWPFGERALSPQREG